jgi:glutamyl-tRNA synthetase
MPTTRLAPSPTGALHLGNARTFLVNWLLGRRLGWKIILRIEDLDGPRVKPAADVQAIDDLRWLGLNWDSGPIYQSTRAHHYRAAADGLVGAGIAYPCVCTRRESETAASAPHAEDGAAVYPGTCRDRFKSVADARAQSGREPALRFKVTPRVVEIDDQFAGTHRIDVGALGDFVIFKSDGTAAYHLAVVVDDAAMEISDVVRGDDLLESAARQVLIYQALGFSEKIPRWWHLPLVVGTDGRRLAKRHGDTRLDYYRRGGVSSQRILGLLARWCGIPCTDETTPDELLKVFEIHQLPHQRIIFTPTDDAWLLKKYLIP